MVTSRLLARSENPSRYEYPGGSVADSEKSIWGVAPVILGESQLSRMDRSGSVILHDLKITGEMLSIICSN